MVLHNAHSFAQELEQSRLTAGCSFRSVIRYFSTNARKIGIEVSVALLRSRIDRLPRSLAALGRLQVSVRELASYSNWQ
jgi:hypothetical protein